MLYQLSYYRNLCPLRAFFGCKDKEKFLFLQARYATLHVAG